jgi:hypothetical protein
MSVTGACAEVIYLNGSEHEPDFERAVSNEELVEAVKARLRRLQPGERVSEPVTPTTPFGI